MPPLFRTFFAQKKKERILFLSILPQKRGRRRRLVLQHVRTIEIRVARVVFIAFRVFNSTRVIREEARRVRKSACIIFYHLFFAEGKKNRPTFLVTGKTCRFCKDGLVHHTGRIATETIERQAREEQGRAKVYEEGEKSTREVRVGGRFRRRFFVGVL